MKEQLLALADRCEREEPSAELQQAIGLALGWTWKIGVSTRWFEPNGTEAHRLPDWLHSLDAAVTLVPEWHRWSVETGTMCNAVVHNLEALFPGDRTKVTGRSARPAPALCAAALRARAALCSHDYEAQDDKGWACKLCGHQT